MHLVGRSVGQSVSQSVSGLFTLFVLSRGLVVLCVLRRGSMRTVWWRQSFPFLCSQTTVSLTEMQLIPCSTMSAAWANQRSKPWTLCWQLTRREACSWLLDFMLHTQEGSRSEKFKCVHQHCMWQFVGMKISSFYCIIFQTHVRFHMHISSPKESHNQISLGNAF
jgi:hypothetical protein